MNFLREVLFDHRSVGKVRRSQLSQEGPAAVVSRSPRPEPIPRVNEGRDDKCGVGERTEDRPSPGFFGHARRPPNWIANLGGLSGDRVVFIV